MRILDRKEKQVKLHGPPIRKQCNCPQSQQPTRNSSRSKITHTQTQIAARVRAEGEHEMLWRDIFSADQAVGGNWPVLSPFSPLRTLACEKFWGKKIDRTSTVLMKGLAIAKSGRQQAYQSETRRALISWKTRPMRIAVCVGDAAGEWWKQDWFNSARNDDSACVSMNNCKKELKAMEMVEEFDCLLLPPSKKCDNCWVTCNKTCEISESRAIGRILLSDISWKTCVRNPGDNSEFSSSVLFCIKLEAHNSFCTELFVTNKKNINKNVFVMNTLLDLPLQTAILCSPHATRNLKSADWCWNLCYFIRVCQGEGENGKTATLFRVSLLVSGPHSGLKSLPFLTHLRGVLN